MPHDNNNAALEQRIYSVEKGQTALGERVDALASGLDARIDRLTQTIERKFTEASADRKPQWQAFSMIATVAIFVLGSFGALSVAFIQGQIGYVNDKTEQNRALIGNTVPRIEIDSWREEAKARDDRVSAAITQLRSDTVSIDAHQAVLDRVTHLESTVGNITPVGDVIRDLQDQVKRLQAQFFMAGRTSASPGGPMNAQ